MSPEIRNADVLVLGQAVTSCTETIEDYLRCRCRKLATIVLAGIRQRLLGRYSLFENGKLVDISHFPSLYIKGTSAYYQMLTFFYYLLQSISVIFSMLRLRTRFHFVIGISTFYAFMGIFLKRLGLVDYVIYYCLDYYPSRTLMSRIFIKLDKFCAENSDMVWNLSSAISEARHSNLESSLVRERLTEMLVPMTYSSKLLTYRPLAEIERQSIGFVGTLERLQGLQLLVEAMPEILKCLPDLKVKIIGDGSYANELKKLVRESDLDEHFVFYGFIKEKPKIVDILSRCAIGVAPYIPTPENNALTGDVSKPKLYTFCGLPTIITKIPSGLLIDSRGAGIAIDYAPHEFAKAVVKLLCDDQTLEKYRSNAHLFAQSYTSERVFSHALKTTLQSFNRKKVGQ